MTLPDLRKCRAGCRLENVGVDFSTEVAPSFNLGTYGIAVGHPYFVKLAKPPFACFFCHRLKTVFERCRLMPTPLESESHGNHLLTCGYDLLCCVAATSPWA